MLHCLESPPLPSPPLPVIQHLSHLHSWMDHQTFFKLVYETHAGFLPSCLSSIQIGNTPLYRHGTIGLHTLWSAKHVWSYVFFLRFDPPSKCSLTPVIGLFVCRKANPRQLSFFCPCCVKASKWCVVGKWNITVDNICLSLGSELIEARPWLSVPLLSLYLHLQGQPRTLGQDFPYPTLLLYKMPLGFRWTFVAFAGTMEAVGCWTMQCSESMGEKKGGNPHIMFCKGPSVTFASQQIWFSLTGEEKTFEKLTELYQIKQT